MAAFGAFFLWGIIPLYFKELGSISAVEIIAHRIVWSLVFVVIIVIATKRIFHVKEVFTNKNTLLIFTATTTLIAINWLTFVWAITNGRVLDASLGYYINPLVNVLLGVLFLGERLNKWQGLAVAFAAGAVFILTFQAGSLPWISLVLAFSFGFYGLLRKKAPTESVVGLTVETSLLFPLSLGYLIYIIFFGSVQGENNGGQFYDSTTLILLMGTGIVTAVPLILFSVGAQRLKLSTVGLLQYIAPTMQVVLAAYVFMEPFSETQLIAFGLIWVGLIIYSWDGFRNRKRH